ncbi:MAG: HPr family phosphocarrier protein [Thermoguttaceae bacterium]
MLKKEVTVKNKQGFHLRPATMIAKVARGASSSVYLSNGGVETDCTDVLDLLSLEAHAGSVLILTVDGDDEQAVADSIVGLFERRFDED